MEQINQVDPSTMPNDRVIPVIPEQEIYKPELHTCDMENNEDVVAENENHAEDVIETSEETKPSNDVDAAHTEEINTPIDTIEITPEVKQSFSRARNTETSIFKGTRVGKIELI